MSDDGPDGRTARAGRRGERSVWQRRVHLLLVIPFAALLAVPTYAREAPALLGWPFFYWYQFAVGLLTIGLMAIVYRVTRGAFPEEAPESPEPTDRSQ